MLIKQRDSFDPRVNVTVKLKKDGKVIDKRVSHNVFTNVGRAWLVQLFGSSAYSEDPPTPHNTAKIMYVGFGCGGALQTEAGYLRGQQELVTVQALQDPVSIAAVGDGFQYLKVLDNQTVTTAHFPGNFRTLFTCDLAESEISFSGSYTRGSNVNVGTNVPVSEAGLYLSTAGAYYTADPEDGSDPLIDNYLVCYDTFSPVWVTPGVTLSIEWELRV